MDLLAAADAQTLLGNRSAANGEAGAAWVRELPALIAEAAARWSLTLEPHFQGLSYNYVAPVRLPGGEPAVLKLCFPDPGGDFLHEEAALRAFQGPACVPLLASDLELGALLLERLSPGTNLSEVADDAGEVSAAVAVMREISRPPPEGHGFPSIDGWLEGVAGVAAAGEQRLDWLDAGIALGRNLVATPSAASVLLHGDLHHWNVLSSGDAWRCIDPHGVTGEPAWEVGPYLYNNLPDEAGERSWRGTIRRRADQFADELALDRERLYACAAVYAVISSAWDIDYIDQRPGWFAKHRAVMRELAGF